MFGLLRFLSSMILQQEIEFVKGVIEII